MCAGAADLRFSINIQFYSRPNTGTFACTLVYARTFTLTLPCMCVCLLLRKPRSKHCSPPRSLSHVLSYHRLDADPDITQAAERPRIVSGTLGWFVWTESKRPPMSRPPTEESLSWPKRVSHTLPIGLYNKDPKIRTIKATRQ